MGSVHEYDPTMIDRFCKANIEAKREAEETAKDPFGRHRWVKLRDLKSNTELNDKYAEIIRKLDDNAKNVDGRFAVRVDGYKKDKTIISVKRTNLEAIPDDETVKVCRLASLGEEGCHLTVRWPLAILQSSRYPSTLSPISARLGFPLRITKVKPYSKLKKQSDFDNHWVTYMMVELHNGFAPPNWQSYVGPVVVWRDGTCASVSTDDMCLLNDYLSNLMDQYSYGDVCPDRDITPERWEQEKADILTDREETETLVNYNDINI